MKRSRGAGIMGKAALIAAGSVAFSAGLGRLGFRVRPKPLPPHSERTPELSLVDFPTGLPDPVHRHLRSTLGEMVPEIETAVVWGRARFKVKGFWTPMRFKGYYASGQGFRRDMEITWFGVPVLRGGDAYLGGEGSLKITGLLRMTDKGARIDQGENLAMWGEAPFTTPSALVLDPRVRWEPVDAYTARLIVPFGDKEEILRVEFDPHTGLMRSMSGMRYREQEKTKTPWRGWYSEWKTLHGIKVPHHVASSWEDQVEPYIIMNLEGAEYNVDVSEKVPESGAAEA